MPASRWAGFVLIWIGVLVFVVDAVVASNRHGRATRRAAAR